MTRHIQIVISGKVENTGFRLYAMWGANEFEIKGEVRQNQGNIIIDAEGEPEALEDFMNWCRKGPYGSVVHDVFCFEKDYYGFEDFKIL